MSERGDSLAREASETQPQPRRLSSRVRQSRRQILKSAGALGVAGLTGLAGCSGDGASAGDGGSVEMPDSITIVQENVPDTAALESLLKDFEEETGITAEMTTDSYETLQEKIPTQLQSDDPDFDVAIQDIYWIGDFAEGGLTRPLDDRIADSDAIDPDIYFDPVWSGTATYDDTTYGVPFFHYAHAMMYRTDILEDSDLESEYGGDFGRPESVEDYVDLAKFLTRDTNDDGEIDFYGAAMQGQRGIPINDEYMNYFQGLGGTFATPDGEVKVDEHEDTAVEALEVYIDMLNNAAPEASKQWKFSEAMEFLGNGDAFSMFTYHVLYPILAGNTDAGENLGFAPVAGTSPPLGGWSWALPRSLDEGRTEAAWRFIEWAESFDTRKQRMLNGGSPTARDVIDDDEVVESNPTFFEQQAEIISNAKPFPNVPGTTQAVQNWGTELSQAVAGNKDPEQAVADGIDRVKNALE